MGVKIAVVGGGSTYTPELVEGFEARRDRMPIDELVLLDTDPRRLEIVGGLAQRMLDRLDWTGRLRCTGDREAAIDGADFVLIQLRVGGQAARLVDETLPPTFGVIGQETTGAGGFAKALRTVPVVLELAELTARRGAPGAWIVDFTNPVGIVSQALLDAGHRAIGLCNVAINLQRGMAERFGVSPDRVELEHVGLNHLSWERAVRVDGVDRLPELIEGDADELGSLVGVPGELVRAVRAIPSYYLHYYYQTRQVVDDQRDGHTRAQEVIDIEGQLLELYQDQGLAEKPALLATRGGAYYSEAAAQLIASLHDGARRHPGGRRPQRRGAPRPARRGRRRDPGQDRPRRGASPPPRAAVARHARPGRGGQGVRDAGDRGGDDRRPRDGAAGTAREPAGRRLRHRGAAAGRAAGGQPGAPAAVLRVGRSARVSRLARP